MKGRKMPRLRCLLIACFTFFLNSFLFSQQTETTLLTLERIFSSREFAGERFGPARWLEDGSGYTTLEASENHSSGRDLVRYDPQTGRRDRLVTAQRLIPPVIPRRCPSKITNGRQTAGGF